MTTIMRTQAGSFEIRLRLGSHREGHRDVQEYQVGMQFLGGLNRGLAIFGLCNHFAGFLHDGPKGVAEDRVVVGDDCAEPYLPNTFLEDDLQTLHAMIQAHPLATLITAGSSGLLANLVPFTLVDGGENGTLRAHIAKANDQVSALSSGAETLVVFQGPEAYITPSWYVSKQEHGRVVPTWNYAVVQVSGTPRVIDDPDWLRA